jgi:hypothetical protein
MRSVLLVLLIVAAACGGISKRTIEEDPAAGTGGQAAAGGGGKLPAGARGGTGGTSGSGGSVSAGTGGSTEPALPDPCNIGWLDIPVACPADQTSILEAPTCNAIFRCYLGSICLGGAQCKTCLQAFESGLSGTMSLCVHGTLSELELTCLTAPPDAEGIPTSCVP